MIPHRKNAFHIPTRPYSPIDALNRRAAATGSPRYAELATHADYNGHPVTVAFNDYRQWYTAEYVWSGRVVLARGSFEHCLRAAVEEHQRGALGASTDVFPLDEHVSLCRAEPLLVEGNEPDPLPWWTWRHSAAAESARDMANPRAASRIFDWPLMEAADSLEAYEAAVKAKHGRVWAW